MAEENQNNNLLGANEPGGNPAIPCTNIDFPFLCAPAVQSHPATFRDVKLASSELRRLEDAGANDMDIERAAQRLRAVEDSHFYPHSVDPRSLSHIQQQLTIISRQQQQMQVQLAVVVSQLAEVKQELRDEVVEIRKDLLSMSIVQARTANKVMGKATYSLPPKAQGPAGPQLSLSSPDPLPDVVPRGSVPRWPLRFQEKPEHKAFADYLLGELKSQEIQWYQQFYEESCEIKSGDTIFERRRKFLVWLTLG
jgi:hypothetical protein